MSSQYEWVEVAKVFCGPAGNPFKNRPSGRLLIAAAPVSLAGAVLPYTRLGAQGRFYRRHALL